jgi:hypothetical protein
MLPPDKYAKYFINEKIIFEFSKIFRTKFQKQLCLRALVNPSPKGGPVDENGMPLVCKPVRNYLSILIFIYYLERMGQIF